MSTEKCAIFIDGGYLDKILERWENFPLDYLKFSKKLCEFIKANLLRVYYYNCLPIIRRMYETNCSRCHKKIEICFKHDGEKKVYCDRCYKDKFRKEPQFSKFSEEETKKDQEFHDEREKFYNKLKKLPRFEVKYGHLQLINGVPKQKAVDVKMSLDIVDKCFENQIQHAIIVAGDSDFIPAIRKAKDYGAIVHLVCNENKVNRRLLLEVDEVHNLKLSFIRDLNAI